MNQTAGIGDPYWYEWSVGQLHLIKMLNPDNGIKSVTFQDQKISGWDDVVVEYDGYNHFYQIKHTRVDDSITFGDLVKKDENGKSLLGYLFQCWKENKKKDNSKYILFTNRHAGKRKQSVIVQSEEIQRPPLEPFFRHLKDLVEQDAQIEFDCIAPEFKEAFQREWLPALEGLNETDTKEIRQFLKDFEIQTNQSDLQQLGNDLVIELQTTFAISRSSAEELLKYLDAGLRKWTTSVRQNRKITREVVYQELGKPINEEVQGHYEPPPVPFFKSREKILAEIEEAIQSPDNRIIFLSGNPGSGKTSVISQLANRRLPVIHLRYYTFHPIAPDNDMIPMDAGKAVTAERLWGDLLTQLREYLKGSLATHKVPVRNDFIQDPIELRNNVIRLAQIVVNEKQLDKLVGEFHGSCRLI